LTLLSYSVNFVFFCFSLHTTSREHNAIAKSIISHMLVVKWCQQSFVKIIKYMSFSISDVWDTGV